MSILSSHDVAKDAAEQFTPLARELLATAVARLNEETVPALKLALEQVLDGMTITVTIARKP